MTIHISFLSLLGVAFSYIIGQLIIWMWEKSEDWDPYQDQDDPKEFIPISCKVKNLLEVCGFFIVCGLVGWFVIWAIT
ncbi:MAG: hypothetical protein KGI50_05260 [Patescibacteria group bacterium]|nr:hypothetical protein [Patescibacteria group bacterium]MDE2438732.1 hypothetical protein [Patescibacteria group bacterium]